MAKANGFLLKRHKLIAVVDFMDVKKDLSARIVNITKKCQDVEMLEPLMIGRTNLENELLFFVGPEIVMLDDADSEKSIDLILAKFIEFKVEIAGVYALSGSAIEKHNIMAKHYGFINVMSNSVSNKADPESRKKIEEAYGLRPGSYELLGGHEYIKKYPMSVDDLDKLWFEEKSVKIRSGFYVRHLKKDGKDIVLVNGFHPKQLAYFTDPNHKIAILLLHSGNSWYNLKNMMVGATFPEKADVGSIRGTLFKDAKSYGFESVTIANNCVHLSAGPYEAMFEIFNFFGNITKSDLRGKEQPHILRRMIASGIPFDKAIRALDNPKLEKDGKHTDLFSATEDMDTTKAISTISDVKTL